MKAWWRKYKGLFEAILFFLVALLIAFSAWCSIQNAERDKDIRARCTCGAFE